ncbi:MAG: hypothetical protein ACR2NL_10270 [Acidimicrobiia bacterium]
MVRAAVVLVALLAASCGGDSTDRTEEPIAATQPQSDDEGPTSAQWTVVFDGITCDATFRASKPDTEFQIEIANTSAANMALIVGTYHQGHSHDDLSAYTDNWPGGPDRPDFVSAAEIIEVPASSERSVAKALPAGQYFGVCMAQPDTMITLDDVNIP